MPRTPRVTTPGHLHHVISRFVDRRWFLTSFRERDRYLSLLGEALARSDWRCLAYCLMSNHLHFAMVAGDLALDSWARKVNAPFANWLNRRHGRLGPVFAERPTVYRVPAVREAHVIAYIHNNPVRAGVVTHARRSSWSSHRAYLGLTKVPSWLRVEEGLARSGFADEPGAFDRFVSKARTSIHVVPDTARLRAQVRRLGAFEIGTPVLAEPIAFPVMCRPFVRVTPSIPKLLEAVAVGVGLPRGTLSRRYARGEVSRAKRVAVHAGVQLGISISDVSAALNISRQRGSKVSLTPLSDDEHRAVLGIVGLLSES